MASVKFRGRSGLHLRTSGETIALGVQWTKWGHRARQGLDPWSNFGLDFKCDKMPLEDFEQRENIITTIATTYSKPLSNLDNKTHNCRLCLTYRRHRERPGSLRQSRWEQLPLSWGRLGRLHLPQCPRRSLRLYFSCPVVRGALLRNPYRSLQAPFWAVRAQGSFRRPSPVTSSPSLLSLRPHP